MIEEEGHKLRLLNEYYKVYQILSNLRQCVGDSEFGYRVQGLFAHTLLGLGIKILEIKPQGHPDILGEHESRYIRFEVEAISGKARKCIIDKEDIEAIRPLNKNEKGFLAFLCCSLPPEWLLIQYERIKYRVYEQVSIITLNSLNDKKFSSECTEYFYGLILSNELHLSGLAFHLLQNKALKGEIVL